MYLTWRKYVASSRYTEALTLELVWVLLPARQLVAASGPQDISFQLLVAVLLISNVSKNGHSQKSGPCAF